MKLNLKSDKMLIFILLTIIIIIFTFFLKLGSWGFNKLPFIFVVDFEERYVQSKESNYFELIDVIDLNLRSDNNYEIYSLLISDIGVVFSFVEIDNFVNFDLIIYKENDEIETGKGAFTNDTALYIECESKSICEFKYKPVENKGFINVYKVLEK